MQEKVSFIKRDFVPPTVELLRFDATDAITTSNPNAFDTRGDEDDFTLRPEM